MSIMLEKTRTSLEKHIREGYPMDGPAAVFEGLQLIRGNSLPVISAFILMALIGGWLGAIHWAGFVVDALVVSPILLGGAILMLGKLRMGQSLEWRDLLSGLPFALPLILFTIVYTLILLILLSPTLYAMYQAGVFEFLQEFFVNPEIIEEALPNFSNINATVIWLNFIPLIYLSVGFWWGVFLILFRQLNFIEALEYSRRLVTRKWFSHFYLLTIYLFMFMMFGMLVSFVALALPAISGVLDVLISAFVFFVFYSSLLVAFDKGIGLHPKEETEITEHLIED